LFIDARSISENQQIESDVCIVGAGPAGLTLAHEFIGQPFRVCLLESGGLETDDATQALARGQNIGLAYPDLDQTRLRRFGGTLGELAWCAPLEEIDFEERVWVPFSGWPFNKAQLDPYYERAQSIIGLEPVNRENATKLPRLSFPGNRAVTKFLQIRVPYTFGQVYRDEIEHAANVHGYLYANVVEIETTETAHSATRLRVACLQGNEFSVSAKLFIIAAGGIENARLLLSSNKIRAVGLGNQNDLVGRFFMEHPHLPSGVFRAIDPLRSAELCGFWYSRNGSEFIRVVALTKQTLIREQLLSVSATLEPVVPLGVVSGTRLLTALRERKWPDHALTHLRNVIEHLEDVGIGLLDTVFNSGCHRIRWFSFYNRMEQAPNPESRVTLSSERDSLGMNRVKLDWRLSAIDRASLKRANEILAAELSRTGSGTLNCNIADESLWPPTLTGGHHHMGTTRMSVDPQKGVVDQHCRVHDISNLFVAGSSIFPTSGWANPTFTIVALAMKLADHIKRLIK